MEFNIKMPKVVIDEDQDGIAALKDAGLQWPTAYASRRGLSPIAPARSRADPSLRSGCSELFGSEGSCRQRARGLSHPERGTPAGLMPAKVSLKPRAMVTAGLAKDVDGMHRQAAVMYVTTTRRPPRPLPATPFDEGDHRQAKHEMRGDDDDSGATRLSKHVGRHFAPRSSRRESPRSPWCWSAARWPCWRSPGAHP